MELNGICQFLKDHGFETEIVRRLRPPRVLISMPKPLSICLCDGDLCLEDFTKIPRATGYRLLARITLARQDSLDRLLEAIHAWNTDARERPDTSGCPADPP